MGYLKLPVRLLLFAIVLFAVLRVLFVVTYTDYFFDDIEFSQLLQAFFYGIRFDLNITTIFLAPILLIGALPFRFVYSPKIQKGLAYLALAVFIGFTVITLVDITYFGEVYRHVGREVTAISEDISFIFEVAFGSRLLNTILGTIFLLLVIVSFYYMVIKNITVAEKLPALPIRIIASVLFIVVCVWLARGMIIKGRPISYADAFDEDAASINQANLILNTPFVVLKQVRAQEQLKPLNLLTPTEQQLALPAKDTFIFQSKIAPTRKNIVLILLESWSYKYIDALAHRGYGATPFMDQLIAQSQTWDHYYAAGKRSIIGIQAILSSVPVFSNHPTLGFGLELNRVSQIGKILDQQHYRTIMMQTSNRRSFNVNSIANVLGFQEYYGKEDVPIIKQYPQEPPHFGWDYDSLQFLLNKLNQTPTEQPFFAFLFTGSTHEPFADAGKEFHLYPHNAANENGFLNVLRYSDWSLEQFMQGAQQQPWYKNTIFIFTADHTLNSLPSENLDEQFHIPLVIFAPDGSLPAQHSPQYASQYDLLPTIMDLLGIQTPISTFGQSLLYPTQTAPALLVGSGEMLGMISPLGNATFVGQKQLTISNDTPALQQQLLQFKLRVTAADELLDKNRWVEEDEDDDEDDQ
ncbi:phosphoglycerol transferase I [Gallibacterium salpingitidis]|uniref:LTA synthase family protein n=1 Tax=Gallibacterium salpingitidis TaxID=505341 RepID=UPI000804AB9B|nr:alkaline phosphatase family protein [Gallibacterium salpingitidis]OBX08317.1 phosphoglycerol transferase I [Gallibacterium salpingitidis]